MTTKEVETQVIQILADQAMLTPGDITLDAKLEDLGIDSLGLVEAIFAIEERFDVAVPFNANDPEASSFNIASVKEIVASVQELVDAQST
jgi:acyl carrier protein